ncbi:MAG: response regulator transcription factor [Deltaproteobacteria bacterium]|nr:response regulator transcription factor [Deltaproteobacteria bacterium]
MLKSQILVVDDHPLFRAGLALAIHREPDLEVVAEVGSAAEAVDIIRTQPVDLAILDVLMPRTNGVSLANDLFDLKPSLKILALSVLDEPAMISAMLRAGASGYATKTQSPDEILGAVRSVLSGHAYLPPQAPRETILAMSKASPDRPLERLTRREREIFNLLIHGNTNEQIGTQLFISRRTVETHRLRIMRKLAATSLIAMIRVAAREGALSE